MTTPHTVERVENAERSPYNAIGLLRMQWSTGGFYLGSGALIDSLHVLTCSHNLIDMQGTGKAGHAVDVSFYPAYNETLPTPPPPGAAVAVGCYSARYQRGEEAWDVGVLRLAKPIPRDYYFVPTETGKEIVHESIALTGYPGKYRGQMFNDVDDVAGVELTTNTLLYTHDTWKGNSGSPTWTYDGMTDTTNQHAIHVSRETEDLKRGVLITAPVLDWIKAAVAVPGQPPFTLVPMP